jgi:ribosomal protein S27AE
MALLHPLRSEAVSETFVVMKFSTKSECPKCGGDRFSWALRTEVEAHGSFAPYEHLRLTCDRCGYGFNMECKDAAR